PGAASPTAVPSGVPVASPGAAAATLAACSPTATATTTAASVRWSRHDREHLRGGGVLEGWPRSQDRYRTMPQLWERSILLPACLQEGTGACAALLQLRAQRRHVRTGSRDLMGSHWLR